MKQFSILSLKTGLSIFAVSILFSSCRKEITTSDIFPCEPIYIDSIERSDTWKSMLVYNQVPQIFTYKNLQGDSLLFQLTWQFNADDEQRTLQKKCETESSLDQLYHINAWHNHRTYASYGSEINFQLDFHIAPVYNIIDQLYWYEWHDIRIKSNFSDTTYHRAMPIVLDQVSVGPHLNITPVEPIPELTINNQQYVNVYISVDGRIYYTFDNGIIAFVDSSDETWFLDRVE